MNRLHPPPPPPLKLLTNLAECCLHNVIRETTPVSKKASDKIQVLPDKAMSFSIKAFI